MDVINRPCHDFNGSITKLPSHLRLCKLCNVVDDEEHFVTECGINTSVRLYLLEIIRSIYPDVDSLDKRQMLVLLMGSADTRIQKWFGKFLYQSSIIRNHSHEILVGSNVWWLIDEWWFAIYSILASIYSTCMCATPSCCARLTRSNFTVMKPIINCTCVIMVLFLNAF